MIYAIQNVLSGMRCPTLNEIMT
jgi:hypothetical protein